MKRLLAIFAVIASCAAPLPTDAAVRAYMTSGVQGGTTIEMPAGSTRKVTLTFKNTGSYVWRGNGKTYVSLYATGPYKRKSVFRDASWSSAYQPARLNESLVSVGKTGSVTLTLRAPDALGTYKEQFQLAAENKDWIYGAVVRLTIKVLPQHVSRETPVGANAYVVMDAETGTIVSEKNANEVRSIASITKLMTVMVAHDAGLNPDAIVALSREDEVGGGRLRVAVGTEVSIRDLVASTIIGSANNAANAVARATGLSREVFVQRMDEKAKSLGLASTTFADPTGIEVQNVSTAREVALMAKAAFSDPWISEFDSEPTYEVATAAGPHVIKNTNKLMSDASVEVLAGKTGFIYEAGYTLVTRLKKEGKPELLVVVLGCETNSQSFRDARTLAEKAWMGTETALAR